MVKEFEKDLMISDYIYIDNLISYMSYTLHRLGIKKLTPKMVDDFKYAICNIYEGGMEPDFNTIESYEKWKYFNIDNLELSNRVINNNNSPYRDPTIKFLKLI